MPMPTEITIMGASGRMGQSLIATALRDTDVRITGLVEHTTNRVVGASIGGVLVSSNVDDSTSKNSVCIDFTSPQCTSENIVKLAAKGIPTVIGTTGLSDSYLHIINEASKLIPIVFSSNFSTGVNLLWKVLASIGEFIPSSYDIELVESHHRFKKDSPSGTALSTAKVIESVRPGKIPIHAIRAGGIVGEHSVVCASLGDVLEFKHSAISRDTFSEGAILAAKWLKNQRPGLYSMQDVLFSQKAI